MMKRIVFCCWLIFIAGCSEEQEVNKLNSQWNVSWKIADEEINGKLLLYNDQYARLQVYGEANSLLVKQTEAVDFYWQLERDQLTLKRIDNDIVLKYQIIHESPDRMELAFAEDITVTLSRH